MVGVLGVRGRVPRWEVVPQDAESVVEVGDRPGMRQVEMVMG